jgi:hypothetical protein
VALLDTATKIANMIIINDPNTNAVMNQRLLIIEANRSLNPVAD